ncbi:hypothetical protein TWF281_001031 [Arthrobotrys megalospora]
MPFVSQLRFQSTTGNTLDSDIPSTLPSSEAREVDNMDPASPTSGAGAGQRVLQRPLCPRYAESISDTESDISDDPLQDSISSNASISSASSVNGDDELELPHGFADLSLTQVSTPLECKKYEAKVEAKDDLPPNLAYPSEKTQDTAPQRIPSIDRSSKLLETLLNKQQYASEVAKAASNETIACFPLGRGKMFTPPQATIDIDSWQEDMRMHGYTHGRQAGFSQGSGGNNGSRALPIYPAHVKPPTEWGTRNQQGSGNEDSYEDGGWGRETRGPRAKKRIACPAAKGDPFHNRDCLGVSFPNLAKTRQHLSCAAHFAVEKTPLLPDEIRDPNGWDEIITYVYPGKDIPSSDEDFHPTMDIIQRRGMGPGKPDFRSTLMRMIRRIMEDQEYGMETLRELESIDPNPQDDYMMMQHPVTLYSSPSTISSYQNCLDTSDSSMYSQQLGLHYNSPINSEASPNVLSSVSMSGMHTPTSGSSGSFPVALSSYGPGITSTGTFGNRQLSSFISQPTIMDTNRCSPAIPDLHHQADSELQTDPASGPSPDRQPQIYVRVLSSDYQFPSDGDLSLFESSAQCIFPGFSFGTCCLRPLGIVGPFINSVQSLCEFYATFRRDYPGQDMLLEVFPKPGSPFVYGQL